MNDTPLFKDKKMPKGIPFQVREHEGSPYARH